MHVAINVKSPNNISKWQMGFNSAFKWLIVKIFNVIIWLLFIVSLCYPFRPKYLLQLFQVCGSVHLQTIIMNKTPTRCTINLKFFKIYLFLHR
jgi:hypothetical protein